MEVKKTYTYSALDKHKLATEQLAHLHKTPVEKAQVVINFLTFLLMKHCRHLKSMTSTRLSCCCKELLTNMN